MTEGRGPLHASLISSLQLRPGRERRSGRRILFGLNLGREFIGDLHLNICSKSSISDRKKDWLLLVAVVLPYVQEFDYLVQLKFQDVQICEQRSTSERPSLKPVFWTAMK